MKSRSFVGGLAMMVVIVSLGLPVGAAVPVARYDTAIQPLGLTFGGQTLSTYATDSFTLTVNATNLTGGFATGETGSGTAYYSIVGNTVTLRIPQVLGRSAANTNGTFSYTGLPAAVQPASGVYVHALVKGYNGSAYTSSYVSLSGGSGTMNVNLLSGNWPSYTVDCGIDMNSITYIRD